MQQITTARLSGDLPPASPTPLAHLLLHHGGSVIHVALVPGKPVVLGRDPSANVVLQDTSLSRLHARVMFDGERVVVEDLRSTNGTIVRGHNLDKPTPLHHGAEIYFGAIMGIVHIPSALPMQALPVERDIVADTDKMKRLVGLAERYATAMAPVLIGGETGTGKEEIAKLIHRRGPRKDKPFVVLNCASIPASLLESLLFGHEKGAFSGAVGLKKGYFETAHEGTLLLDEIGELSLAAQAALLRVIETGRILRVGSLHEISLDIRWIAATWRDLKAMSKEGTFREDLYHRLSVLTLDVPPLRERLDDIPALVGRFLQRANAANGRHVQEIEKGALQTLMAYDWPGNIRELRNWIERAVVISDGETIRSSDFPAHIEEKHSVAPAQRRNLDADKTAVEKAALQEAWQETKGDTDAMAKSLGKSRRQVQRLLKKYRIGPDSGGDE